MKILQKSDVFLILSHHELSVILMALLEASDSATSMCHSMTDVEEFCKKLDREKERWEVEAKG